MYMNMKFSIALIQAKGVQFQY